MNPDKLGDKSKANGEENPPKVEGYPPSNPQVINPTIIQPTQNASFPEPGSNQPQSVTPTEPGQSTQYPPQPQGPSAFGGPAYQAITASKANNGKRRKKLLLGGLGAAVAIALIASGVVFGYVLPNRPENVYRTGIERSGEAIEQLVNSSIEKQNIAKYNNSDLSSDVKIEAPGMKYSGELKSQYDNEQSNSTLTFKSDTEDAENQELAVQFLTELQKDKIYPDIFFKVSGLTSLGLDAFYPQLTEYENKWISVPNDYIAKFVAESGISSEEAKPNEFTSDDAAELAKVITSTTREYVFTNDSSKAVLKQESFVGKENVDGKEMYHYKMGIDAEKAKVFCGVIIDRVTATEAYKHIPEVNDATINEDKTKLIEDCKKSIDEASTDDKAKASFDVWIDKKYKLISKIRITNPETPGSYLDFGHSFNGGKDIPLYLAIHMEEEKIDAKLTLDTNTDLGTTKGTLVVEGKGEDAWKGNVTIDFKPHDGDVTIEKPAGAIHFDELMKALEVDPQTMDFPADDSQGLEIEQDAV
jgi:hypothetical protein